MYSIRNNLRKVLPVFQLLSKYCNVFSSVLGKNNKHENIHFIEDIHENIH